MSLMSVSLLLQQCLVCTVRWEVCGRTTVVYKYSRGTLGEMVTVVRNGHNNSDSNLGQGSNTLGKGMHPTILPPSMRK